MWRKLRISLAVASTLAWPNAVSACSPKPFDVHVWMATRTLKTRTLEPGVRERAEGWLAAARDGNGPRWHGERQKALNELLSLLSMPQVTRAPLEELSPKEQEIELRGEANDTIVSIDQMLATSKLADADLAKVKQLRVQAAELVAAKKWRKAVDKGTEALLVLGASFPRC